MSGEPLFCCFCGAEDFECDCPSPESDEADDLEVEFCEVCGARLDDCECGY